MAKEFIKITFEDLDIAQTFFDNEKHFSEFLCAVVSYYRGKNYQIKTKIVSKYFETYKKTMNHILQSKQYGYKGHNQKVENQTITNKTLEGVVEANTNPPFEESNNNKVISNNNKLEIINNKILLEKGQKFDFRKNLIDYGFNENLVAEWLLVRKNKKATNTETAFKKFIEQIEKTENPFINEILEICIERSWSGFKKEWLNNLQNNNGKQQSANEKRLESLRTFENKLNGLLGESQPN